MEQTLQQFCVLGLLEVHLFGQRVTLIANQVTSTLRLHQQLMQAKQQLYSNSEPLLQRVPTAILSMPPTLAALAQLG